MEDRIMESFVSVDGDEEEESLPQRPILASELSKRTSLLDTDISSKKESLTSILEALAGRFPSVGYCQVSKGVRECVWWLRRCLQCIFFCYDPHFIYSIDPTSPN